MKAAICYETNQPLVIEEVSLAPPEQGEVKVCLAATAICHSDVHYLRGEWDHPATLHRRPRVRRRGRRDRPRSEPGAAGRPRRGLAAALLWPLRFSASPAPPNHCSAEWPLDTESRIRNAAGEPVRHGVRVGGFAEYAIVDQSQLARVPDSMSLQAASLLACGVITGFGAVVNTAQVTAGSTVVVIGTGGVGLNSVAGRGALRRRPVDRSRSPAEQTGRRASVRRQRPGQRRRGRPRGSGKRTDRRAHGRLRLRHRRQRTRHVAGPADDAQVRHDRAGGHAAGKT